MVRRNPADRSLVAVHSGHMTAKRDRAWGDRYAVARNAIPLTQEELAARVETSTKTVQRLESGYRIRLDTLAKIEGVLGFTAERTAEVPGPRARRIDEFSDGEIVTDLWRRLNAARRSNGVTPDGQSPPHTGPRAHIDITADSPEDEIPRGAAGTGH